MTPVLRMETEARGFPDLPREHTKSLWRTNLVVATGMDVPTSWHCVGIVTLDLFLMKHRGRTPYFFSCNRALTTFSKIGIVRWVS